LAANDKTPQRGHVICMQTKSGTTAMIQTIVGDLRAIAERCSRFSKDLSARNLSCVLEELAIELMQKASELENRLDA
jgi:hypothetical protein